MAARCLFDKFIPICRFGATRYVLGDMKADSRQEADMRRIVVASGASVWEGLAELFDRGQSRGRCRSSKRCNEIAPAVSAQGENGIRRLQ